MVAAGCSTKKNTFTRRVYHNLTAHYNAYWNGNESLKEGLRELDGSVQDNYAEILPVYKYGAKEDGTSLAPMMDRAIEKSNKVVRKHSMEFGGKEYVRWIDNSYLMHAKALFYKHEYLKARRKFEYVIREYEAPEKIEAMLWLGHTFAQLEYYGRASSTFDQVKSIIVNGEEEVNNFTRTQLPMMYADLELKQEKYDAAVPHLLNGISLVTKKQQKTRLMFILAQIYQQQEKDELASRYFNDVIKRNPEYAMAFSAKIRLATSVDVDSEQSEEVIEELNKMLKDFKNEEFRDQIYFALGEIAWKKQQDTLAIKNYRLSVAHSISNDFQRASSSLKVADIYFDKRNYPMAKSYYDSALQVLPYDYKNLYKLQRKSYTLSRLVENLETINLQDSLQMLASLSESERVKIVDSIIVAYKLEQQRIKEQEELQQQQAAAMRQNSLTLRASSGISSVGGAWYFYNSQAKSMGYTQFVGEWGRRNLEDNWRLSNKRMTAFFFDEEEDELVEGEEGVVDSTQIVVTDPMKRETYLQYIPLEEDQIKESDTLIAEALYDVGFIYKIQLKDDVQAIESFADYTSRFPEYPDAVKVYYQLYQLYVSEGNTAKAEEVKDIILSRFGDTDYALILQDPEYFDRVQSDHIKLKELYKETYNAFDQGSYMTVKLISEDAIRNYEETELTPRFKFLRAIAIRKIEDSKDTLKYELQQIVKDYPKHEVYTLAQNILKKMEKDADTLSVDEQEDKQKQEQLARAMETYVENMKTGHFYIIFVNSDSVNVSAAKTRVADHNKKFFKNEKLKVSSVVYSKKVRMITVSQFHNSLEAMTYFNSIAENEYVFNIIGEKSFKHFVISSENYPKLYKSKNIVDYQVFFEANYIPEGEYPKMGRMEF